jgi:hypothetical protein
LDNSTEKQLELASSSGCYNLWTKKDIRIKYS